MLQITFATLGIFCVRSISISCFSTKRLVCKAIIHGQHDFTIYNLPPWNNKLFVSI